MKKVFILGVDGGTWDIFRPLMENGSMPNLRELSQNGKAGILKSTIPPVTAPAWTSFQTGVHPDTHGLYDFLKYTPGSYDTSLISSRDIKQETIWDIVGNTGKKVIAVNVPMTYPPKEINGILLGGLLSPGETAHFTYPDGIYSELVDAVGEYIITAEPQLFASRDVEKITRRLIHIEEKRTEAALYLMDRYEWDLFMLHNQSLDGLQHALWPYLNPNSTGLDQKDAAAAQKFFHELDHQIGRIRQQLGPDTLLILMSDHGFRAVHKMINLNSLLHATGFLKYKSTAALTQVEALIKKVDILKLRRFWDFHKKENLRSKINESLAINWSKTQAFVLQGFVYGHIHVNLAGREKHGIVDIPQGYEEVRTELVKMLTGLEDPQTKQRVIEEVYRREEIYQGPKSQTAPDLIVKPKEGYLFTKKIGVREIFSECRLHIDSVGSHSENGIYLFHGKGITLGSLETEMQITDMAPTILDYLDVDTPEHMQGHSRIPELWNR